MIIWNDRYFICLLGLLLIGGLLWLILRHLSNPAIARPSRLGYNTLTVLMTFVGLGINGLRIYFLIQPFYKFGQSLTVGVLAVFVGVFFLYEVFRFAQKK